MQGLVDLLAGLPLAEWMRVSRWGYAGANTLHVIGLSLLFGAIVPLDLRLLGLWQGRIPLAALARALVPVAATGLVLALVSGTLLFLSAPADYAAAPLFLAKIGLVLLGAGSALLTHMAAPKGAADGDMADRLAQLSPARLRLAGALSLVVWTAALVCGRMLAFTGD